MLTQNGSFRRSFKTISVAADLVVGGGGIAGVCAAITAARAGLRVTLIQDQPVLGGNASSEVRLWILGATSHMGNNNRWAREGGIIDEILIENLYRNPEGNPILVDALLLEFVHREPNITLLLNTVIHDLEREDNRIRSVRAFCSQNSTAYEVEAPLFCDATGDGCIGFLAGAPFRMGAEASSEFGEGMAPTEEYGELLGHSLYFYTRDTGKPVKFVAPSFALDDITKIPRFRRFNTREYGCKLWWLEYGGRLDTVHDTEAIKWELWKVVYGVWHYIKNSGEFPEADTMTLEWVGAIPGKRESRRFEGDYMLTQRDLVDQVEHPDAVSFGGWAIDLHPADGVFSEKPGCNQWHMKGIYGIPYRSLYSRNIDNLFLAGRIISASHVAFGSTRVMATCGHTAQAVGMAAALCAREGLLPRDLAGRKQIEILKLELARTGQYIPGYTLSDPEDLASTAEIVPSSELHLRRLPPDGPLVPLNDPWAQMLPIPAGPMPKIRLWLSAIEGTIARAELRIAERPDNHTPEITLASRDIVLGAGADHAIDLEFDVTIDQPRYVFITLKSNPSVSVRTSETRVTGLLSVTHAFNRAVAESATQTPPPGSGMPTFEFWFPKRRPYGQNFAFELEPPLSAYSVSNLINGRGRPISSTNAWAAELSEEKPSLELRWETPQSPRSIVLGFDPDWDHPLESVLMGHPEREIPFCVGNYRILDGNRNELIAVRGNHLSRREHRLPDDLVTDTLIIELERPSPNVPAALFEVRCYS
jgi:hypothetical protein